MPKGTDIGVIIKAARFPFTAPAAAGYARKAAAAAGYKGGKLCILFTCDARIRKLNRKYKGRDRATDVLAFDTGDIAISADTARKNAAYYGSTTKNELKLYIVHGILHLCGYRDATAAEKKKMRKAEERVLSKI